MERPKQTQSIRAERDDTTRLWGVDAAQWCGGAVVLMKERYGAHASDQRAQERRSRKRHGDSEERQRVVDRKTRPWRRGSADGIEIWSESVGAAPRLGGGKRHPKKVRRVRAFSSGIRSAFVPT